MNRVDRMTWASDGRGGEGSAKPRGRLPIELSLVVIALGGELLGAIAHPLLGPGLAIAAATLLMARHMAAEVRALDAWDGR